MEIRNFMDLYLKIAGPGQFIAAFTTGHLAIEFLLRKLIQVYDPKLSNLADNLKHYQLIKLNHELGTIDDQQREVLTLINKIRNRFAHNLTYELDHKELMDLFKKSARAFSDMTDGIHQGLVELSTVKSVSELDEWVIPELFAQIFNDLHNEYQSRGGDFEDF